MTHFKDIMEYYKSNVRLDGIKAWDIIGEMGESLAKNKDIDKEAFWETMKDFHEDVFGEHFNEPYAEWQVSQMYHTDSKGKKCTEPMFSMTEAKAIYDKKLKGHHKDITPCDVYVALNAQYHDNINLYERWFPDADGDAMEAIIIESTLNDWIEDEDASDEKVWRYFRAI